MKFHGDVQVKQCIKCSMVRPVQDFYAHPDMFDGYLGACKTCHKIDVVLNYKAHRKQYQIYEHERFQRPERKANIVQYQRNRRKDNPIKYKANTMLCNAIKRGKITPKPCEVCDTKKVEGHHPDYTEPLKVIWLCRKHHLALHGKVANES